MSACSSLTQRTPTGWIVSATQILFSWFLVWPLEMRVPSQRCLFLILNWTYIYALVCSVIWNMKMHHFVNYLNSDFAPLASYITSTLECTQKHKFWNTFNFFFPLSCFVKLSQQHRQLSTKTNLTAQIRQVFWQGNCTEWWRTRSVILSAIILIIDASHQAKKK